MSSSSNQDVRREERERNQRERQQVSRHSQQRNEDSVPAPHQVSASLLFDTPIKKEKPDETSKMIEKTLGDFNQVSKYLMSSDHKQIIGISTHEIHKKNKMEGDKARIEQILKEIKGLPPITGLDDSDHENGNLDSQPTLSNNRIHSSNERNHFLDERSSSGVSDDESSSRNNTNTSYPKTKGHHNQFVSHEWRSKRLNEAVNQAEPLLKRVRKTSEGNINSCHRQRSTLNGKGDRNKLNLSGNESSSPSSRSSSSDSDSESASSSSSENESMADVASHNMSGLEEGDEGEVMKTVDSLQDGDHLAINPNYTANTTAEVDNPVGSWNLMSFMHKDAFKNSPRREEDDGSGGLCPEAAAAADKYTKTINKVAVGLPSSPLLSSASSPEQDSPPTLSPNRTESGSKQRKTNNSLSTTHEQINSQVVNKSSSSKQFKGNESKERSERSGNCSAGGFQSSLVAKTSSPRRLSSRDGGSGNNVRKSDPSCKSKRPTPRKVSPSKNNVPSKENYKPVTVQSVEKDIKSIPEIVPKQLICSIDCQMLKRVPRGLNMKKESFVSTKKEKQLERDTSNTDTDRNPRSSPPSSSQKVSKTSHFSSNEGKSQQKSDVSSPRVPPSATKKDPSSPPSPPHIPAATSSSSLPNRSQPPSQSGPSGLPFPASCSIVSTSYPSETLNSVTDSSSQETSVDCCLVNAKKLKHAADSESERSAKFCKYIESILYFVLTGNAKELRNDNFIEIIKMYADTGTLLHHATGNFMKTSSSTSASDNKLLALSLRCQSVINSKIYRLRAKEKFENSRLIKDIKANTEVKTGEVSIPTSSFLCMKKQLEIYKFLDLALSNWAQVDSICQKHPSCKAFFDTLDKECTPLSLTSSAENLVAYVRTGLKILR